MKLIIFINFLSQIFAIWPPAYKIHLNHSETFMISDMFDTDDANDFNSDDLEMIKNPELKNADKYYMLHRMALRKNQENWKNEQFVVRKKGKKPREISYVKYNEPAYAGFVDKNGDIDLNKNVYYSNEMVKAAVEKEISQRSPRRDLFDADYDYNKLHNEYLDDMRAEEKSKNVLKYEQVTEEEGAKDSVKNILKFKEVKNCTEEEMKGIGWNAAKCFMQDFSHLQGKKDKKRLFKAITKMIVIWFVVYVFIAVPLWCQKGWCCCCCPFKICKPRQSIDETKMFLANNPVGTLHNDDGAVVTYQPTIYERYAQKRLEQAVLKL